MTELADNRKQRLRSLESQIRSNYEAFVATGFALKEIRDDELFKEDGFETWNAYLKERVGETFGIEERQVYRLITCAQVRTKLPDIPNLSGSTNSEKSEEKWSQLEILEFARLAPKSEGGQGRPGPDLDALKKRDVERVAKKVIEHCETEEIPITSSVVRKFVDEDLGIDRAEQAKETKRQRETASRPELRQFLIDLTGRIDAEREKLQTLPPNVWKRFGEENAGVIKRLVTACQSLTELLKEAEG